MEQHLHFGIVLFIIKTYHPFFRASIKIAIGFEHDLTIYQYPQPFVLGRPMFVVYIRESGQSEKWADIDKPPTGPRREKNAYHHLSYCTVARVHGAIK
jgi:hypothetical protein